MSSYGTFRNRTKALPLAIVVTIMFAMFPVSWLGWTSDIADLVRVPVTPLSHVGMMVKSWVRPAIEPSDLPTDEQERHELAVAERDHYRQLYHSQMLRATELADQLRVLQSLPESALRNPMPPLVVPLDLTGIKPNDSSGVVELKLSRGTAGRILDGDIVIVGRDIVGRIARVGMTRVELLPTSHKDSGFIRAGIVPSHPLHGGRPPLLDEILLQPRGDGYLTAEISSKKDVQENDLVVLDDPAWSISGNGLVLGIVTSITPLDEAPLRKIVTVTPRQRAREHAGVVVLGTGDGESQ
jgi:hypothetical protein|tara:strand:- start:1484 stop:2374 length:891 start_codon:yes stop_codon:yes gene_type:complete